MPEARLIRRRSFRASHRYGLEAWSEERNRRVFGAQVEAHWHDWRLEVHVVGPVDPETGFATDLGALDGAIDDLLDGWDGSDLNEVVPPVREGLVQPTTEALARWIFDSLAGRVAPPARLARVRLFESPELGAEYPA